METISPEKIKEINEYGREIIELLKLDTSPVAVVLLSKGAEVPGYSENRPKMIPEIKPRNIQEVMLILGNRIFGISYTVRISWLNRVECPGLILKFH